MEEKQRFTLMNLLRGIRRKAIDFLGLDMLSEQYATLALNYMFVMVYYTLELIFVNTLIFRVSGGNMHSIWIYRGLSYFFCAVGMNLCAAFASRITPVRAIKIAGALYIALYVIMFVWMDRLSSLMYYIGCLSGLAMGLYWSGHNVLIALYTTPRNRALGIGITGIISGIMNLMLPLLSGFVIQLMPEMTGYRVMFGVAIVIILSQFYFMNKLTTVERRHRKGGYRFALRLVAKKLSLRLMLCFEFVRCVREGAFAFFLNMLLFNIVTNESLVGFNSFLTGVTSIAGAWAFGRLVVPERRVRLALASTVGLFVFGATLLFKLNAVTVILYGIVNTFLAYFLNNIGLHFSYEIMGENEALRGVLTELTGIRQAAQDFGRICGICILALFPNNNDGYLTAMMVLIGTQFITVALMWAYTRVRDRKLLRKNKEEPAS